MSLKAAPGKILVKLLEDFPVGMSFKNMKPKMRKRFSQDVSVSGINYVTEIEPHFGSAVVLDVSEGYWARKKGTKDNPKFEWIVHEDVKVGDVIMLDIHASRFSTFLTKWGWLVSLREVDVYLVDDDLSKELRGNFDPWK